MSMFLMPFIECVGNVNSTNWKWWELFFKVVFFKFIFTLY